MASGRSKPTAEEKREESRRIILSAALELFYTKGYEATTTRDIVAKAGILNGSLYNRFKSKEDILLSIVTEMVSDCLEESKKLFADSRDPVLALCLPFSLEVYVASKSPKIAELAFEAHHSWAALEAYESIYRDWMLSILAPHVQEQLDDEKLHIGMVSLLGVLGNICGMYAHGLSKDYRDIVEGMLKFAAVMMEIPMFDIRSEVGKISEAVENSNISVCGHSLSELAALDRFPGIQSRGFYQKPAMGPA